MDDLELSANTLSATQQAPRGRPIADRIPQSQWWVARSESGSRRIDAAEFIEFCIGCGVAPPAALIGLMKLRR
jgi:hypothetical protein